MGETSEGQPVTKVVTSVSTLLQNNDIGAAEKLRLLLVYLITQEGVRESDCEKLMEMARVSHSDRATIKNLVYLGFQLGKGIKREKKDKKDKKKDAQEDYELNRFKPAIAKVITEHIEDKLSTTEFPFVKDPVAGTSARSASVDGRSARTTKKKAGWADAKKNKDKKDVVEEPTFSGPRLIVFIVGGMTHSEMRTAYECTKKLSREVIIGSTHLLTPKSFISTVGEISGAA